jgi:hypothetical protein
MLIQPWDAALEPAEWQDWLACADRFGMLAVNNAGQGCAAHRSSRGPKDLGCAGVGS